MPLNDRTGASVSRRNALKGLGTLSAAGLAGCIGGGEDVTLRIAHSPGTFGDWIQEFFHDPFTEETGIEIETVEGPAGELVSQVIAEGDDPSLDGIMFAHDDTAVLHHQDLVLGDLPDRVDNSDQVDQEFIYDWTLPFMITPWGICVNESMAEIEVTSWDDLTHPSFEGMVGIPDWGWHAPMWFTAMNQIFGGDFDNLDPGLEYVRELVEENDAILAPSNDDALTQFTQREIGVAPFWQARTVGLDQDQSDDYNFVYPEEGTIGASYGPAVIEGRGNEEEMVQYVESILDPVKIGEFVTTLNYPPGVPEAMDHVPDDVVEAAPSMVLTDEILDSFAQLELDLEGLTVNRDEMGEAFRRVTTN